MKDRYEVFSQQLTILDGIVAMAIALACVVYGNSTRLPTGTVEQFLQARITITNAGFAAFFMLAWSYCFRFLRKPQSDGILRKLALTIKGCGWMSLLLASYLSASSTTGPTARITASFFLLSLCYKAGQILLSHYIASHDPQSVIILGSGRGASKAWRAIRTQYHSTIKLLGFVDTRATSEMSPDIAARYLGSIDDLGELLLRNVVDELVIALPMKSCYEQAQRAVAVADRVGVRVAYMPGMYTVSPSAHRQNDPFSELAPFHDRYVARQVLKRIFDVVGALVGLFLLAPLFCAIGIAISLTSPGLVFFVQERHGFRRRLFNMYKFRSMIENAPELLADLEHRNEAVGPIFKIKHDPRVTRLGRFLRASSLDELPQLFNVLLGNMSLVGPRPMSVRDVSLFNEATLMRRFTVKPGLTGLWQVSGRSDVGFDQWIESDLSYIDGWSLALDLQILARTVKVVAKRTGAI